MSQPAQAILVLGLDGKSRAKIVPSPPEESSAGKDNGMVSGERGDTLQRRCYRPSVAYPAVSFIVDLKVNTDLKTLPGTAVLESF